MLRKCLLHIIAAALVTGQAIAVSAAEKPNGTAATRKLAADSTGLPTVVALDSESCRKLVAARPKVQPGADYVPGVDVQGRAVAPADLPPSAGNADWLDPRFGIQLKFTLGQLLGSRVPPQAAQAELSVGKLELDPASGKLSFQRQALEPPAEDAVLAACRAHLDGLKQKKR
ncbi:MAG: hypothetical protein KBB36_17190 [Ferrovibrio sp.]|nr:hypothetical protein [Ferrovibrio sp.]